MKLYDFKYKEHLVYSDKPNKVIAITRVLLNGGVVKTVKLNDVSGDYWDVLSKLNNIVGLDDEMFNMIADNQRDELTNK